MPNSTFKIIVLPRTKMAHADVLNRCHEIFVLEAKTFDQLLVLKQILDEAIVEKKNDLILQVKENTFFEIKEGLYIVKRKENYSSMFHKLWKIMLYVVVITIWYM